MSIYIRISLLCLCLLNLAAEPLDPTTTDKKPQPLRLPTEGATDSDGNPIVIPSQHQSALHYRSPNTPTKKTKTTKRQSNKSTRQQKMSRKQLLASRQHVANDPSCRWLDKRMQQLENRLKHQKKQHFGFQADELKVRKSEWICLKCGAEGPSQNDHNKCQYKR